MRYASDIERRAARLRQRREYYQRHKVEVKVYNQAYNARVKPGRTQKRKDAAWAGYLKKKYGLTVERYNEMVAACNGQCPICGPNIKVHSKDAHYLYVDHNHRTLVVRGVICDRCNRLIGLADEDPMVLRSAARYLHMHEGGW